MVDCAHASGIVYGGGGAILYFVTPGVVGQGDDCVPVWSGAIRSFAVCKYIFGGGH